MCFPYGKHSKLLKKEYNQVQETHSAALKVEKINIDSVKTKF